MKSNDKIPKQSKHAETAVRNLGLLPSSRSAAFLDQANATGIIIRHDITIKI